MKVSKTVSAFLLGSAATLAGTSAFAIPNNINQSCEPKPEVCCPDPKPGPFGFAFPQDLDLNCPADVSFHADFLIFQAKQDGMEFVLENTNGQTLPITRGHVLGFSHDNTDYGYNPGLRLGLGFNVHHDAWSVDFEWAWLNIKNYKDYRTQGAGTLIPLWFVPQTVDTSWRTAGAAWSADYNTFDITLGKPYHVSRYLILNPHIGLRAGWIDQHFSVHYGGTFNGVANGTVHHGDNDFWGVGTRAGIKTDWVLGKGWSIFGNIAASLLFGHFDVDQELAVGSGTTNQGFDLEYEYYQNVPNMEIQLGLSWHKYFSRDRYRFGLSAAWEFQEWWDQLNMRKFFGTTTSVSAYQWQNDTVARGNFTLDGFSLSASLDL